MSCAYWEFLAYNNFVNQKLGTRKESISPFCVKMKKRTVNYSSKLVDTLKGENSMDNFLKLSNTN